MLQDFAKACADGALLVFVFSDGHALPMLQSSSASSRTERVYEVGDISDQDVVAFVRAHCGGVRDEAQAQELVRTITGGRFNLLRILGSSAAPVAAHLEAFIKSAAQRAELDGRRWRWW